MAGADPKLTVVCRTATEFEAFTGGPHFETKKELIEVAADTKPRTVKYNSTGTFVAYVTTKKVIIQETESNKIVLSLNSDRALDVSFSPASKFFCVFERYAKPTSRSQRLTRMSGYFHWKLASKWQRSRSNSMQSGNRAGALMTH